MVYSPAVERAARAQPGTLITLRWPWKSFEENVELVKPTVPATIPAPYVPRF